jgi:hypothetical protein
VLVGFWFQRDVDSMSLKSISSTFDDRYFIRILVFIMEEHSHPSVKNSGRYKHYGNLRVGNQCRSQEVSLCRFCPSV